MSEEQKSSDGVQIPPSIAEAKLTIHPQVRWRQEPGVLFLDLDFGGDEATWYGPAASVGVSIPTFKDEDQARQWMDWATDLFLKDVQAAIVDSLRLLLGDASGRATIETGLGFYDINGVIAGHLAFAETLLRQRLGLAPTVAWPPWRVDELVRVIFQAMQGSASTPTYNSVTKKIQEKFPGRPPTTGEALRKVVGEYGINWMKLKRMAKKTE